MDPIEAPLDNVAGEARRLVPDVTTGEVIGAASQAEAIETDYWFMTGREEREIRDRAYEIAQGLGYEAEGEKFGPHIVAPMPTLEDYEFPREFAAIEARKAHPEAFEGVPITQEEIDAWVAEKLRAEWDDAQAVMGAAPDTFWGRMVPEFVGRMGTAATDEVNVALMVGTAGVGSTANLGRLMLIEGSLGVAGEALTLPKQYAMAERLDIPEPNAALQLAFGGAVGAAAPVVLRGLGKTVGAGGRAAQNIYLGMTNRELLRDLRQRASELSPKERAAAAAIERQVIEEDVGPAARGLDNVGATDEAVEIMDGMKAGDVDAPPADARRVEKLVTAPEDPEPANLPPILSDPPSIETSIRGLIRHSEARNSYDTPSDYTVIPPSKPLTQMTINEVEAWQTANIRAGAESTAAGGYQIISGTLRHLRDKMGLTGDELFDGAMQDRMADVLMDEAGLTRWKNGEITAEAFADNLAGVWAAFPLASGLSRYHGDGLNAATISRAQVMRVLGGEIFVSNRRAPPVMVRVPGAGVGVDPRSYQFRTNVDGAGVGTPLDRVTEWDELLAGDFIIHERRDGTRWIADGHHRHDLSRRLEAEGHTPIMYNAFLLREDEGYTVEAVRAIAAVKNIEAGNASAIDAAKVLRVDPDMLAKLTLRSSHARDARGLMRLSDEGFDMVTNGLVREDHAAIVGELTQEAAMQEGILRAMLGAKPRSLAEARQVAADAYRAGLARADAKAQGSLFGDDFDIAETLFAERAKVMARAMAQLRNDKRVFSTLVNERNRIKDAGNDLLEEANQKRVETDGAALALVEKLVNRAGPLDDALDAAARAVRGGGNVQSAVGDFLGSIRSAIEGGDIGRLLDGGNGGRGDAPTPHGRADEGAGGRGGRSIEDAGQDAPGARVERTEAGDQLVIEGVDPVTARDRLEAAQATPMRGGEAPADGGLFDLAARDQADLFSDADPMTPEARAQTVAAERDVRRAVEAGDLDQVPTGRMVNGEPETMPAADVLADLDMDDDFLGALDVCG